LFELFTSFIYISKVNNTSSVLTSKTPSPTGEGKYHFALAKYHCEVPRSLALGQRSFEATNNINKYNKRKERL
jgi:hypothetical protein